MVSNNFYAGQSRAQYFNLSAFAPTPAGAGRFGNAGVGILEGPGTAAVSLGVAKQFRITEKLHARFESTFTNVLNHTNFAPPVTAIDSSTFGALTGPQTAENAGNRTGQAALRLDFQLLPCQRIPGRPRSVGQGRDIAHYYGKQGVRAGKF